jgi:hypothetical protein
MFPGLLAAPAAATARAIGLRTGLDIIPSPIASPVRPLAIAATDDGRQACSCALGRSDAVALAMGRMAGGA